MDLLPETHADPPRRPRKPWAVAGAAAVGVATLAVGTLLTFGGTAGAATAAPSGTPGPTVGPNPAASQTLHLPDVPEGPATDLPATSTYTGGELPGIRITLGPDMDSAAAFCGLFDRPASDCTRSTVDGLTVYTFEREADVLFFNGRHHGVQKVQGKVLPVGVSMANP